MSGPYSMSLPKGHRGAWRPGSLPFQVAATEWPPRSRG